MSDPLSVAGSAVGIISLGIQVCQGLISYLQSFKGQDQEIQDSLNDVQTVTSILCALKGILPKVDKCSSETPVIRQCLIETEEKLREFQHLSLKLRGTQITEHDVLAKMDHTRRALLYPFREGKLKSLCQSLKGVLQNLSLWGIAVGIYTNVEDLENAFKDQGTNVAKLSDQLQRLDNSMSTYYQDLKTEISRTQLFAQDFRQEIGGQLRLISTDVGSLMSINQRHQEDMSQRVMKAFDELKEQNNFQNELIRTALGMDGMSIQNTGSRQAPSLARTRVSKQHTIDPHDCTCERQQEYSTLSYRFWHAIFEESSPHDQDEEGKSHALIALEIILVAIIGISDESIAQSTRESISISAKRLIETLVSTAGNENGKLEHIFELHPIIQAIFQESISMLEIALCKSPEAVTETIDGVTTVELCLHWPEGLRKLLRTKAVDVLDERSLQLAVKADCIESVDMLFKAGCPVDYGRITEAIFNTASEQCMDVIASNLARRRSDLLSLVQQHQVICQDLVLTSDIPDDQAGYLCSCLDNSGISIPLALRVPSSYSTIYHFCVIRDTGSSDAGITDWCIEVIRFLTFEALEMTHTCCEFAVIKRPDISSKKFNALMNCKPQRWQRIRSDKREQENAVLLETLMDEFIAYMVGMESSPRSLEVFVNGYWRQRISEIYAVDGDEIKNIKNCLSLTSWKDVLPDRVRPLLSEDFKLIELQDLKSGPTPFGETSHDEKPESSDESFELLPCEWCSYFRK
ncbi:hypothetical protein FANTH_2540 [Fusarium anthophilum]|uniref:Fungal N-terminal domain-containing protein n=1 Tax=Fusarium anthophilum TaxID=48485 RepID=A0A8H4ZV83_9HYPO|nr:hypothetical protein FANTH_2540 [Fusarium anthophilum]